VTGPDARLVNALSDRYHIERELGAGGMATVYLAQDLRHERRVAVKVLRPELAAVIGADRFLQEIKTTANLQHPHILPLHDSGVADNLLFYVMPYVEGESLRDLLHREKQLEIGRAVELARQVASALDYAHRHGVIHRDIKPENVLIHDKQALVADFGIALAVSSGGATRMTETGMSVGTPQYMSPEQAMGDRELDARSDIYSLGAMLYEMLAGEPPYTGNTAQAIVAKIITEKVSPVTIWRDTVPSNVSAALQKALAKLPADRFPSAAEFAEALVNPAFAISGPMAAVAGDARRAPTRSPLRWLWPALALVFAAVAGWALLRPASEAPVSRYALAFPEGQELHVNNYQSYALAPDGSYLVYVGPEANGYGEQLWVKLRGELEATALAGTVNAWAPTPSPDGAWIAFLSQRQLRRIPTIGGAPITLSDSIQVSNATSPSWGDDDVITFVDQQWRIRRVPGTGGVATVAWSPPSNRFAGHLSPLPGGRGILFQLCDQACRTVAEVHVLDLESDSAWTLIPGALRAWYADGMVTYVRPDGGMFAQPFDLGDLTLGGSAIPVLYGIRVDGGYLAQAVVGGDGSLLYARGVAAEAGNVAEAVWIERNGEMTAVDTTWRFDPRGNAGWALSPDGKRLAIKLAGEGGDQIWIKELDRGPQSRITFDSAGTDIRPRWLPDGETVSYVSEREGRQGIYTRRGDGTGIEELRLETDRPIWEAVWSRDGKWLVVRTGGVAGSLGDRDVYAMEIGVDTVLRPLLVSAADERAIALSPDGRWLAYESNESGENQVFVRPFPDMNAGKWQVSIGGGRAPLWAHSGRELFYVSTGADQQMMVADIAASQRFEVTDRRVLFPLAPELLGSVNYTPWDVTPDDQRFIMVRSLAGGQAGAASQVVLVTNWIQEMRAKTGR